MKQEALKWEALNRLSKSPEYLEYLKPILEQAFNNLWPDPAESETVEGFFKQYTEQYGRAMAYKEIFNILSNASAVVINLSKQQDDKKTAPYNLGA